jgi:hypothetical protein
MFEVHRVLHDKDKEKMKAGMEGFGFYGKMELLGSYRVLVATASASFLVFLW